MRIHEQAARLQQLCNLFLPDILQQTSLVLFKREERMGKVSLVFEQLNLRWNPFGEPDIEDIASLAVVDVEEYIERLKSPGFAVQYLGESGRGKSTHMLALHQFFPDMPYLKFPENTKIPKIPHAPVLFLDETQRLPPRLRRRIFARKASFVIGTHENHTSEMLKAGVELVSIHLSGLTVERLTEIVRRRLEWARRGPGALPWLSTSKINQLIEVYGDDLSAILDCLYEDFQTLQEGANDGT